MKIYFYNSNKKSITSYTFELLKHIASKNGHDVLKEPHDADIIGISLTGYQEIDILIAARKKYKGKKIIVGGHAVNNPFGLLAFCDYVCLGHAFELFRDCRNVSDLEKQSYIVTKEKRYGKYSDYIDWSLCPLVQIGKNSYSILYSTGCRNKCKFCLTSHVNRYQVNPYKQRILKAKKYCGSKQLYLITNDYDNAIDIKRKVSDVTIKEYLKKPDSYKDIGLLRLGIESPVESTRKMLRKHIKDSELKEFFRITGILKKRVNIFMIAGLDSMNSFLYFSDMFDYSFESSPAVGIIINYFDPQPLTPMYDYDLTQTQEIDIPEIKKVLKMKNGRIVIFRDHIVNPYHPMMISMMLRSDENSIKTILDFRKKEQFIRKVGKHFEFSGLDVFFDKSKKYGIYKYLKKGTDTVIETYYSRIKKGLNNENNKTVV
jgi:hypothetical protein